MILGLEVKVQFKFILAWIFIDIMVVQNLLLTSYANTVCNIF